MTMTMKIILQPIRVLIPQNVVTLPRLCSYFTRNQQLHDQQSLNDVRIQKSLYTHFEIFRTFFLVFLSGN